MERGRGVVTLCFGNDLHNSHNKRDTSHDRVMEKQTSDLEVDSLGNEPPKVEPETETEATAVGGSDITKQTSVQEYMLYS